jgi:hypothetical protein
MSLIQDALKRKSEEPGESRPPEIPGEPSLDQPAEEIPPRPLFSILSIVLISVLLIILSGLGIYLIIPKHQASVQQPAPVAAIEPAAVIAPAPPEPVAVPAAPAPVIAPPVESAKVEPAKADPVAEPVKNDEPALAAQIVWPELKLTGIAQSGNQSIAILNGKMLITGRKLGEVLVKEVHETDVIVEYLGECRVLYINE